MSDLSTYQGIFPAFYACYDSSGDVCLKRVSQLTKHLLHKGIQGLYVGGSSGECIYQSVPERKAVLEEVVRSAEGKLTIIAHVACNNTRDSCELAAHAESLGVHAIAAIPPIYFKLPEHAIATYWNTISLAAPKSDFIIYNIPQLAGVSLTMPLFKEMLKNPRLKGVKNSSMPVQDIQQFKAEGCRNGREFVVFNGPDEQLISGLMMGADGGIGGTYAFMPELYLRMYELVTSREDLSMAREIQYAVNNIIYRLCSGTGNMYAMIKEVLRLREGLDIGGVRAPLTNLCGEDLNIAEDCAEMIDAAISMWCSPSICVDGRE